MNFGTTLLRVKMTKQETFNIVVEHLRKQNAKALNSIGKCVYLAPDGKMCAAGVLIPKEDYKPEFDSDGSTFYNAHGLTTLGEILECQEGHDLDLVTDLQMIHDSSNVENWEDGFYQVAQYHNLSYV
jgi:hypothetical protein